MNTFKGKTYRNSPCYVCDVCKKITSYVRKGGKSSIEICECEYPFNWYDNSISSSISVRKVSESISKNYLSTMNFDTSWIKKERSRRIRRKSKILTKKITKNEEFESDFNYPEYINNILWICF